MAWEGVEGWGHIDYWNDVFTFLKSYVSCLGKKNIYIYITLYFIS